MSVSEYLLTRQAVLNTLDDAISVSASGDTSDLSRSLGHQLPTHISLRGTATSSLAYSLPSHQHFFPLQPTGLAGLSNGRSTTEDIMFAAAIEAERRRLGAVQNALFQQHLLANQAAERQRQQDSYISLLRANQARSSLLALSRADLPKAATSSLRSTSQDFYGSDRHGSSKKMCTLPTAIPNQAVSAETTSKRYADAFETIEILCALGTKPRGNAKDYPYVDVSHLPVTGEAPQSVRGGVTAPFTQKLYNMLEDVEAKGKSHIVSFFPHGRSFAIHDMPAFVNEILPKYFEKQSKRVSFVRQLNLYGFIRIDSGLESGGYYHELFLKGRPDLNGYMRRVGASVANREDRRKTKERHVMVIPPNFYAVDEIHPRRRVD